jgi:hypothetical protein
MRAIWLAAALLVAAGLLGCRVRHGWEDRPSTRDEKGPFSVYCQWVTSNEVTACFCFKDGFNGNGRMTWAPEGMCRRKEG